MVAGCGNKCVKYTFWIINFLFFALGAVIVGLSLWMRFDTSFLGNFISTAHVDVSRLPLETFYYILYGIIVLGAILLVLGFFGCCGSACECLSVIGIYFILVIILFVVKIVAIILYFVNKDTLRTHVVNLFRNEMVGNYNKQQVIRDVMDAVQNSLKCCGATGCNDYTAFAIVPPASCSCQNNPPGCAIQIWDLLQSHLVIVIAVAAFILVVELFAMIFSCILCGAVKEKRSETY